LPPNLGERLQALATQYPHIQDLLDLAEEFPT